MTPAAAPPVAPPRDPQASPDHPTWWLVPPGAHHGQGGEKRKKPSSDPGCYHRIAQPNQKTTAELLVLRAFGVGFCVLCALSHSASSTPLELVYIGTKAAPVAPVRPDLGSPWKLET
jgi:hypothetical protein